MKRKILLLACIGILGTAVYGNEFTPERNSLNFKMGITDGELKPDGEIGDLYGDQDTSANISLNLEYIASSPSGLEYGLGVGFVKIEPNETDDVRSVIGDIDTYPIYGLLRYKFDTGTYWNPYIFGNLGYAYADETFTIALDTGDINADVEGGLYYAFGIGTEYKEDFSIEFFWSRTELEWDEPGYSEDIDADLFTLAMGYRLDM